MAQPASLPESTLSAQEMESLAFGYAAAKNARSAERTIAFCAESFVFALSSVPTVRVRGHSEVAQHLTALWEVFPDLYSHVDRHVVGPTGLIATGSLTGTMRGHYFGVPPTGRAFSVALVSSFEFGEERIRQETNFVDSLALFAQLALPSEVVTSILREASS